MTAVDNIAFIRKIYRFLEVDESFMPTIANKSVNAPIFPSTQQLIYKLGLSFIIDTMKRLRLIYTIRHAYKQFQGTKIKNTDPDIQSRLVEVYRAPNDQLSRLIERDLSHWQ